MRREYISYDRANPRAGTARTLEEFEAQYRSLIEEMNQQAQDDIDELRRLDPQKPKDQP